MKANIFDKIDRVFTFVVATLFVAMVFGFASCSDADEEELIASATNSEFEAFCKNNDIQIIGDTIIFKEGLREHLSINYAGVFTLRLNWKQLQQKINWNELDLVAMNDTIIYYAKDLDGMIIKANNGVSERECKIRGSKMHFTFQYNVIRKLDTKLLIYADWATTDGFNDYHFCWEIETFGNPNISTWKVDYNSKGW